jgi:hypothetical protein
MTRSPLFYPLRRGADADAGGAADLQTDVMRFMAILSLCLVAIFALVQSMPLMPPPAALPVTQVGDAVHTVEAITDSTPQPVAAPQEQIRLTRPAPASIVVTEEQPALQRPRAQSERSATPAPAAQPSTPAAAPEEAPMPGFTLQFATDAALTRLVARQVVGVYAIAPEQTSRMSIEDDQVSFWPASMPATFHEMDQATVPDEVLAAYGRAGRTEKITWGVTLPADMSRELNKYLANAEGGSLVIAANGKIDLRR